MRVDFVSDLIDERYQLGAVIGSGGMAEVREGDDLRLNRRVAIKLLRDDLADQALPRDRFETEARAAARIADPRVVAIYDSGEHEGVPFIVMECLSGRTLGDEIAEGPLSESRARDVLEQVLGALQAAHAQGVLHRDIKPGNILLADEGAVKVADFGIAKTTDDADTTMAGAVLGTPSYLAPERLTGGAATVAGDLYAAGVVLYEALAGTKPFQADTPLGVVHAIAYAEPPPLRELRPDVSDDLVAVVERAMAKDPAARFPDAATMRAVLTGEAAAPDATVALALPVAAAEPSPDPDAPDTMYAPLVTMLPVRRRRPRAVVVAVAAVLLVLGIAAAKESALGGSGIAPSTTVAPTTTVAPITVPPTEPTTAPPATAAPRPAKHGHK